MAEETVAAKMLASKEAIERYINQPCPANAVLMAHSIDVWAPALRWANFGIVRAVREECDRITDVSNWATLLVEVLFFLASVCRGWQSPTWVDYHLLSWQFRPGEKHIRALHARFHLPIDPRSSWAEAGSAARRKVVAARRDSAAFDRAWRDYVRKQCNDCWFTVTSFHPPTDPL